MIFWITGLSGSGKTTLSNFLIKKLNKKFKKKIIHLDGDSIRNIFNDLGYSLEDRLKNAERISKLVNLLNKNLDVIIVVSILSVSNKWLSWNKKNNKNYFQIFLNVPLKILKKKNNKKIYLNKRNVVGLDIKYHKPKKNNFIFFNNYKYSFLINSTKQILEDNNVKKILKKYEKS